MTLSHGLLSTSHAPFLTRDHLIEVLGASPLSSALSSRGCKVFLNAESVNILIWANSIYRYISMLSPCTHYCCSLQVDSYIYLE